ncbi:hotdog fold thioesterase [Novosphingobium huizhouense]|uniref:hotdog fold thioesterase n=1 Tax=Novosphingobium huizhouense TaxID=2866625 RepID=UPI00296F3DB7|nr:hotdog fold thioesterase [Novosphingobium huizhouense]
MIWFGGKAPGEDYLRGSFKTAMPGFLGIEYVSIDDTSLTLRMPVTEKVHQPFGRLHGGASVVLAETAGSMAAAFCVDPEKFACVGMEINANHIRPVRDGFVYATATAESIGRTTQVWSIRIRDEAERLVCISRLTVAVIPVERK